MFILHTYSVGGAERRCVAIANHLASKGIKVKIVLLDINKMYACRKDHNGLEIDIQLVDSPKVNIPVNKLVEVVYLLHEGEKNTIADDRIKCIPFCANDKPNIDPIDYLSDTSEASKKAKKQLQVLNDMYVGRLYHYIKQFPDYKVISWMTFCNLATAVAMQELTNDFAFVECTSPDIEFPIDGAMNCLKKVFYQRANAGFFQTEEICDFYHFLSNIKKYVISNPILKTLPKPYDGARKNKIVNFCRIEKPKNLELLIEAFKMFNEYHSEYHLYIIGDGSEKPALQAKVSNYNLNACVHFLPFDSDVHNGIIDFAMYVSTSNREGISNSMIEAMAIGLPTICTDCHGGGAKATIVDGENGLLVPMNDKKALCEAMRRIVETAGLSDLLSKNASKISDTNSINKIGDKWFDAVLDNWRDIICESGNNDAL